MKLSRTMGYAIQATVCLAQVGEGKVVTCAKVAESGNMPERFLLQIMRSLVTHGILDSIRGVDGGYRLSRSAEEISLLDVIEAIDGPVCQPESNTIGLSPEVNTKLEENMLIVKEALSNELGKIKISDLVDLKPAEAVENDASSVNK